MPRSRRRERRAQNRLRAGLDYEISTGCENAKGKAFDDFQSFLTSSLTELETSYASPMLAHMVRDSKMYAKLDVERRQRLLQYLRWVGVVLVVCGGWPLRDHSPIPILLRIVKT